MSEVKNFDVVIVGAGIAGSSLAMSLSGNGLRIAVIEAQSLELSSLSTEPNVHNFDARVSALTPRSRSLLNSLGAWSAIENYRLCTYTHMTVWDAQGTGQIEFDSAEVDGAALGHIVENCAIVNALVEQMQTAADITLLDSQTLQGCTRTDASKGHSERTSEAPGEIRVELSGGEQLCAPLLVAADGALSRVRELFEFETREWDYGHRAIVATIQVEHPHQETAWQSFSLDGPLALLPLPSTDDEHYCSIVWSQRDEATDKLLALDDAAFCAALQRAAENRLGKVLASSKRFAFPLRQRHAVDYVQPGVALIADAAHTIHPLAGQGINLGLQDVAVLAEELLSAHSRGLGLGEPAVLQRYQRRRKGENLLMMAAMDGFKRLFEQPALPLRWLRNVGMRGLDGLLPIKREIMRHAMGLD